MTTLVLSAGTTVKPNACEWYSTCRYNTRGGGFSICGPGSGFKLSERLLRGGKICGMAWEIENDVWGRFPMSIVVSSVWFLIFLYFLRIFFNCVFYAFYKENQGLEVPRETRLEK